jgi:hypothetical protein
MRSRSDTNSRRLPPELTEHIINYLHDSPEDLRSCALVCKAWLAHSRSHLFYKIAIHPAPILPSCRRLQHAIQQSPHVALCVRELSFSPGKSFPEELEDSERVELSTILPQIFRSFTRLRKLVLFDLLWDELVSDVKKSLQDILSLPSLVHFFAWHATFSSPESFLDLLHYQLKRLEVYIYGFGGMVSEAMDGEGEQQTVVKRQPCRLTSLGLYLMEVEFIDWLLGSQSLIDISAVRTLCLRSTRHNVARLLRTLGASLEHLKLWGVLPNFYLLHMFMHNAPRGLSHPQN